MADDEPDTPSPIRIDREIGDDSVELDAVAAEVVAGKAIKDARIKNLRALVEAVQRHPDARLAPPREELGQQSRPPSNDSPDALTNLSIEGGEISECSCKSLDCRVTLTISGATFLGSALFEGACFQGPASFNEASFRSEASFHRSEFARSASFQDTIFADFTRFDKATFAGWTSFYITHFKSVAHFNESTFKDYVRFQRVCFDNEARFDQSRFMSNASFRWSFFAGRAMLDYMTFNEDAQLDWMTFMEGAQFDFTIFASDVSFVETTFVEYASFAGAQFRRHVEGDLRQAFLRSAYFTSPWVRQSKPVLRRPLRSIAIGARDWFGWRTVRALGQLAILNRVSIIALISVPILASLTDALRVQFPKWPSLGASLALTFFAALAVTLALLVYQIWAPQELRKHDEDEFIDTAHRRYPEKAKDRDDGLRRAIQHIEDIAKRRPDRHPNLVRHHGDTIWIPPRDRIHWFEDWTLPDRHRSDSNDPRGAAREARSMVPGAERRRITIEEGAKAEYWLKSHKYWGMAWVSMFLYLIGIGCLLVILGIQAKAVAQAAGWWEKEQSPATHDAQGQ